MATLSTEVFMNTPVTIRYITGNWKGNKLCCLKISILSLTVLVFVIKCPIAFSNAPHIPQSTIYPLPMCQPLFGHHNFTNIVRFYYTISLCAWIWYCFKTEFKGYKNFISTIMRFTHGGFSKCPIAISNAPPHPPTHHIPSSHVPAPFWAPQFYKHSKVLLYNQPMCVNLVLF